MASESSKKKVFDIAKPGKTAASPNARPTIIGHGPIMKDPMVAGSKATSDIADKDSKADSSDEKPTAPALGKETVIAAPEVDPVKDDKPEPKSVPVKDQDTELSEPASDDTAGKESGDEDQEADGEPAEAADKPKDKEADDKPASSDSAAVDTLAANAEAQKKAEKEQQEAVAKQAALEKLVDDKKYFVPIGEAKRTRANERALLILMLVIIVALFAADLLIDAGIIRTSLKPPIQIFHKQQQ